MKDADLQPLIEAARAYESLFVPALFSPWASRVAEAARVAQGERALDVACGTGVLARELQRRTGPSGRVTGVDPGPGMLAVARERAPEIEWREGIAEAQPFPEGAFDVVASQFGLMFFKDRERAIREMQRVLVPGGRLAVAVWDAIERIPAYADVVDLLQRVAGQPAADALRLPFALGDAKGLGSLFESAWGGPVQVTTPRCVAEFPSIRIMVEADLRGWLPMVGVALSEETIARTLAEAENALARYVIAGGRVRFETGAHIVTATRAS